MIKDFNTLNDFFNAVNKDVVVNDFVRTYGFGEVNDGGCGLYKVKSVSATVSDVITFDGLEVTCAGYTLELIPENGTVRVEQFGIAANCDFENMTAKEKIELLFKNKNAIQAAVDSGASRVEFSPGTYYVAEDILIDHPVDIVGNGAKLVLETDSTSTQLFRVAYDATVGDNPPTGSIRDMKILGTHTITQVQETDSDTDEVKTVEKITNYNNGIKLVNVTSFSVSGVDFEYGNYAIQASDLNSSEELIKNIRIANCNTKFTNCGFYLVGVVGAFISDCKIELADNLVNVTNQSGVSIISNSRSVTVEDVSVFNATTGISVASNKINVTDNTGNTNSTNEKVDTIGAATDRIFIKNFLAENCGDMAQVYFNTLPVHFSNAMAVDVKAGLRLRQCENLSVSNSSILLLPPAKCPVNDSAAIVLYGSAKAKFSHTQFEFPRDFHIVSSMYDNKDSELSFTDCTLQKTDIPETDGVTKSIGFGRFGFLGGSPKPFNEVFDACEFRSYIKDYSTTTGEGENTVTSYNFPAEIAVMKNNNSKLIIKNCRFVNDSPCTIPYFKLNYLNDDFNSEVANENIVIYNCFFENYEFSRGEGNDECYPIFGRVVGNDIDIETEEKEGAGESAVSIHKYNIFAKCNMRSSKPVRNTGTTINEMLEYI